MASMNKGGVKLEKLHVTALPLSAGDNKYLKNLSSNCKKLPVCKIRLEMFSI